VIAWGPLILLSMMQPVVAAPKSCFPDEAALDPFLVDWYCKHLNAAGPGQLGPGPSYRFTYLPSFDAPRIVTVAREAHQLVVRGIVLSGKGGYEPGKIATNTRRVLSPGEWQLLQQRLENAGMWEPTDINDANGVDGARWILEGRRDGTYRLHDVWSPAPKRFPQFVKACVYLLELADIKPASSELY
jgi:hypothetical protein